MVGGVEEPEALAAYLERVWTLAEVTPGRGRSKGGQRWAWSPEA